MTLLAFLQAFTTQKISVTLSDPTGEIITFNSEGYEGVEADILAREVNSWGVASSKAIAVQVAAIPKPAGSITLSKDEVTLTSVGATDTVTVTEATGDVTAVSSDLAVASVTIDKSGTDPIITIEEVAEGTATITVTAAETPEHQAATATISVACSV